MDVTKGGIALRESLVQAPKAPLPIERTVEGISNSSNELQIPHVSSGIASIIHEDLTLLSLGQVEKTELPKELTLAGIIISSRELHIPKALSPIEVIVGGRTTEDKNPAALIKDAGIAIIPEGITMPTSFVDEKQPGPKDSTPKGITIEDRLPKYPKQFVDKDLTVVPSIILVTQSLSAPPL